MVVTSTPSPTTTRTDRDWTFTILTGTVLAVCFLLSWDSLTLLARAAGQRTTFAPVYSVPVDALAAAAWRASIRLQHAPWRIRRVPLLISVGFVLLSACGNAFRAYAHNGHLAIPAGVAVVVDAVPPVAGAVIIHLQALVRRWAAPALTGITGITGITADDPRIGDDRAPLPPDGETDTARAARQRAYAHTRIAQTIADGGQVTPADVRSWFRDDPRPPADSTARKYLNTIRSATG